MEASLEVIVLDNTGQVHHITEELHLHIFGHFNRPILGDTPNIVSALDPLTSGVLRLFGSPANQLPTDDQPLHRSLLDACQQ